MAHVLGMAGEGGTLEDSDISVYNFWPVSNKQKCINHYVDDLAMVAKKVPSNKRNIDLCLLLAKPLVTLSQGMQISPNELDISMENIKL